MSNNCVKGLVTKIFLGSEKLEVIGIFALGHAHMACSEHLFEGSPLTTSSFQNLA